jgi:hypothetical protein
VNIPILVPLLLFERRGRPDARNSGTAVNESY